VKVNGEVSHNIIILQPLWNNALNPLTYIVSLSDRKSHASYLYNCASTKVIFGNLIIHAWILFRHFTWNKWNSKYSHTECESAVMNRSMITLMKNI